MPASTGSGTSTRTGTRTGTGTGTRTGTRTRTCTCTCTCTCTAASPVFQCQQYLLLGLAAQQFTEVRQPRRTGLRAATEAGDDVTHTGPPTRQR